MNADGSENRQLVAEPLQSSSDAAWSPDGRYLAYRTERGTIEIVDPDAGTLRVLDDGTDGAAGWGPIWAGDTVFYSKHVPGPTDHRASDLWAVTPDGHRWQVAGPEVVRPQWSPDASRLVYEQQLPDATPSAHGGPLVLVNADGSSRRQIADGATLVPGRAWSPDGTWVAYWKQEHGGSALFGDMYVQEVDSGRETRLREFSSDENPQWAPKTYRLIFGNIDLAALFWLGVRELWPKPFAVVAWSPDAERVAFVQAGGSDAWTLAVRTIGSGQEVALHTTRAQLSHPEWPGYSGAWSPDGRYFAFWSIDREPTAGPVSVLDSETGAVAATGIDVSGWAFLDYSPDGQTRLVQGGLLTDTLSVWAMEADGSGARKLVGGTGLLGGAGQLMAWRPGQPATVACIPGTVPSFDPPLAAGDCVTGLVTLPDSDEVVIGTRSGKLGLIQAGRATMVVPPGASGPATGLQVLSSRLGPTPVAVSFLVDQGVGVLEAHSGTVLTFAVEGWLKGAGWQQAQQMLASDRYLHIGAGRMFVDDPGGYFVMTEQGKAPLWFDLVSDGRVCGSYAANTGAIPHTLWCSQTSLGDGTPAAPSGSGQ